MKKLFAKTTVLLVCLCMLFAGCGNCHHNYDEGQITKDNCAERVLQKTCDKCGDVVEQKLDVVIGHDFDDVVVSGKSAKKCKICGKIEF